MGYPNRELNQRAYRAMKTKLARKFDRGHFVGIHGGKLVADAESFDALIAKLEGLDLDPRQTLIAQAGISQPQNAVIFL
jgi:hypothetical protein